MAAASAGSAVSKESNPISTSNTEQRLSIDSRENAENPGFERTKPPPLDITAAQNAHQGPITPTSTTPRTPKTTRSDRERKIGHRRVDDEGQITYKKIQTSQIMCSIQLGISHSIGGLASKPERDLLMQDFAVIETTFFPNEGSNQTPAHRFTEFRFKTYAPVAFRYFRDLFGIQPDDFLLSMCNEPLRELTNPGASGSIFYLTQDDEFIIKTVQHKEGEFLQKLLPGYYMNLNQNPRTLLPKFFGLYCYQCGGKNIRLVVMNNLLPSSIKMHHKYDLKGSTYKRKASKYERSKPSPTYKDLDFMEHHPEGILLEGETYNALIKTIQRDCRVLESFKIMDYSLLVGIHNLDQAAREKLEKQAQRLLEQENEMEESATTPDGAGPSGTSLMRTKSMNRQKLVAHSTAMEAIQAEADPIDEEDDVPPGGIPARNSKGERLLLYLGIIDILQSYRLRKKLEHTWKSMLHDGDTVSVHRPSFYSQRFQDFMAKTVFKKIPSPLKHSPSRKKSSIRHRPNFGEAKTPDDTAVVPGMAGSPVDGNLGSDPSTTANVKLPAVLHDRGPSMLAKPRVPPPIPPRGSLRRSAEQGAVIGSRSDIPVSSTPPPTFEEATRQDSHMVKARSNTDPVFIQPSDSSKSKPISASAEGSHLDKTDMVSISHITIKTESTLSSQSIVSESSSNTSGFSSTIRTVTWTPPHSVEGSTPTHTEGTPSFTESSSSGDLGCPTTPVRGSIKEAGGAKSGEYTSYQETEMLTKAANRPRDHCEE